ncbi:hypothetical protein NC651_029518 [Populus alba x Populus x berolinensis]|nr:hypothetical protein NC651_029518 [Populus alba x Populus x berolinensis]
MSMELTVHRLPIAQQMDPQCGFELVFKTGFSGVIKSTMFMSRSDKVDVEAEDSFLAAPSISSQPSSSEFLSSTSLPGKYDLILLWTECGFELVFKTDFSGVIKSTMFKSSPYIGSKGGMVGVPNNFESVLEGPQL